MVVWMHGRYPGVDRCRCCTFDLNTIHGRRAAYRYCRAELKMHTLIIFRITRTQYSFVKLPSDTSSSHNIKMKSRLKMLSVDKTHSHIIVRRALIKP